MCLVSGGTAPPSVLTSYRTLPGPFLIVIARSVTTKQSLAIQLTKPQILYILLIL